MEYAKAYPPLTSRPNYGPPRNNKNRTPTAAQKPLDMPDRTTITTSLSTLHTLP